MVDLLSRSDVLELIDHRDELVVSLFLPTHRALPQSEQDRIRLRNLLDEAERQALAGGARPADVRALLAQGRRLLEPAESTFWGHLSDGLAMFLGSRWFRSFRLPEDLPELVVVGESAHVKPLLDLLAADQRFYILALSQNEVRLFEGTRQGVDQVELTEVPQSVDEALRYDELEKQRMFHSGGRGRSTPAIYHGHGVGAEVNKAGLERFLRQVDDALRQTALHDDHAPLVLAGVSHEQAMFRNLTRYPHVLAEGIDGNPEQLSQQELHQRAWRIVEPVATSSRAAAAARFEQASGNGGENAVTELDQVVRAAVQGRVESLFVPAALQRWGAVDAGTLEIEQHSERRPGDTDLLDLAATETIRTSGEVFVVGADQVPGPGPAAALLRY